MNMRLMGAFAVVLAGLGTNAMADTAPAPNPPDQQAPKLKDYTPAQILIYATNHLKGLGVGDVLHYAFARTGTLQEPFQDSVDESIAGIATNGKKNVSINFLSGTHHIETNVFEGFNGNPVVMMFLERDVHDMSEITKGSTLYFRNRIRDAFAIVEKSKITKTTITIDGHAADATLLVVEPFVGLPEIDRFRTYEHKTYQFVISDGVPGGIYSVRTVTPGGKDGQPVVEESMTYQSKSKS